MSAADCTHHYLLSDTQYHEVAKDLVICETEGRCKYCGQSRTFRSKSHELYDPWRDFDLRETMTAVTL